MNKYIKIALVAITSTALLVGCATVPNQNTQTAITAAASLGTAYDLQQRPSDLPYFIAAEQELYSIANSTNAVTAKTVNAVLAEAGQTNAFVNVAIITAVNIGNSYVTQQGTNSAGIKAVCGWIADGIDQSAQPFVKSIKKSVKKK